MRTGQTLGLVGESGSGMSTAEVVEVADQATLYAKPAHEYTKELLAASPTTRVALSRSVARGRSMFPAEESR